jgi:hypothetical protein
MHIYIRFMTLIVRTLIEKAGVDTLHIILTSTSISGKLRNQPLDWTADEQHKELLLIHISSQAELELDCTVLSTSANNNGFHYSSTSSPVITLCQK